MDKFNEIKSRNDLAKFLKIPIKKLTYMLYVKKIDYYYDSFEIPKKNGDVRLINAPKGDLKELQRKLTDALWVAQKEFMKNEKKCANISHGFEKKKGIITNAKIHRNKRFVLNLDFEDFFDSFHFGRVRGYFVKNRNFQLPIEVATIIAQLTCYNGKLPQGAPSSPIVTNLICNILDIRLVKIAKKFKVDYTRYADDLTFSTNDKYFIENQVGFYKEIKKEVEGFGLAINDKKTRLSYKDSRQEVTGLIVNKKLSVKREYCKYTRTMADYLYKYGEFKIDGVEGTIKQLEGRFTYIDQLDHYNNKLDDKNHNFWNLNSREKQYRKFLFYKYFFANSKPLVVTEGKTDIVYLRAALKNNYEDYPSLIEKNGDKYTYKISFLRRTSRLRYFLNISLDGADTMKNIYNFFIGKNQFPNYLKYFMDKSNSMPKNPVVLVFDNEQKSKRPLREFLGYIKLKKNESLNGKLHLNIEKNLYLLTNPLVKGKSECEIEDLFEDSVLSNKIDGKSFSKENKFDINKYYGKSDFSRHVSSNYKKINFSNFKPMLYELEKIVKEYDKF